VEWLNMSVLHTEIWFWDQQFTLKSLCLQWGEEDFNWRGRKSALGGNWKWQVFEDTEVNASVKKSF
jgi:hypothetical protein